MCVLTLAWDIHSDWLLVAAGNRDEAHGRPSAPLARWSDGSGIIGGRDLQSGGMWLGVAEPHPRFAVVTNVTGPNPPDPAKLSRGGLVHDALARRAPFATLEPGRYNPFNLIVVAEDEARERTNRPEPLDRRLSNGWHAVSNGVLDAPWDRKERLTAVARALLAAEPARPEGLLAALDDRAAGPPPHDVRPIFLQRSLRDTVQHRCGRRSRRARPDLGATLRCGRRRHRGNGDRLPLDDLTTSPPCGPGRLALRNRLDRMPPKHRLHRVRPATGAKTRDAQAMISTEPPRPVRASRTVRPPTIFRR